MKLVSLILISVFAFSSAQADRRGSDAREFMVSLKSFVKTCTEEFCETPNEIKKIYSYNDELILISDIITQFGKIAWEQAQIWGDTILEGDYQAAGDTRLDAVYALYRDNKLVGYRIIYSETAWSTADCHVEGNDHKALEQCVAGRITEASFVSPSLKTYVTDENQFAEFQAD